MKLPKMMNQGKNMATGAGCLILKPTSSHHHHKQPSEDAKLSINHHYSKSPTSSSTSAKCCTRTAELPKSTKKQSGSKTKKGKSCNAFRIVGNTITGNKSDKVGIFGFGNTKYVCKAPKTEKRDKACGETDSKSSSDDEE
ncbi:hypothetical protein D8674_007818 [Pyrus ussuriensis x Pyrus communis]|uniref:Uncharacterized protein n=1 Tax=Pyrus ussuriensis x Pyrus communis TaxID=2448454 RepID=A0A5N5HR41_9ROSA|nr:hypothetical protein D8674_007818 [Pyrus ussuriensis x Pyrus communis]